MKQRINRFLDLLRGPKIVEDGHLTHDDTSRNIICEIFTNGNCGNLAIIMADLFNGKLCCNHNHAYVEVEIEGVKTYWDIDGEFHAPQTINYVTEQDLQNKMFVDNYSFAERGPLC